MGQNGNVQVDRRAIERVINALEDPRYDWRTVEGVAEQTGVTPSIVREILKESEHEIVRSSVPDESGQSLYTTRKHYRQSNGLGTRILSALSDRIT
jgi:ribosomal protein S25